MTESVELMGDEGPKVSVVIPVYNTEAYLRQCLDSVVNQTLEDIEIICVDDGSTDGSLAILEEYAAADPRMTILRQQNQYAGVARNNGMARARGKYLMFWDSDDYFDLTALEKMYNQAEADEADICVCGGKRFYEDSQKEYDTNAYLKMGRIPDCIPFNRESNPEGILRFTETATWNKLYRHRFVLDKDIVFQPLRSGNDVFFSILALCEADRITVIDERLVCYRKGRSDSLINTLSAAPLSLPKAWIQVREELERRGVLPEMSFNNRAAAVVKHAFVQIDTWKAFLQCFDYLQQEGLKALGIEPRFEGYYDAGIASFVDRLFEGDPHALLLYLFRSDHSRLVEKSDALTQSRARVRRLREKVARQQEKIKRLDEGQTATVKPVSCVRRALRRLR